MPQRTAQGWVLALCLPTCSLHLSWSSRGVPGLQGHQKEEEAGEDHGLPCSYHAAAAAAAAAAARTFLQLVRHSTSKRGSVTFTAPLVTPSARPPQCTPIAHELLNLHIIAFPCSPRAWKEQKWRRVDLFWEAALPMGAHRHSGLASQKSINIKRSVQRLHKKANCECLYLLLFLSGSLLARN